MNNFNNNDYSSLIQDLIRETNYMDISNRSKIGKIRDFSEILFRKLLNLGSDTQIMLGDTNQYLGSITDIQFKNALKNTIKKILAQKAVLKYTEQNDVSLNAFQKVFHFFPSLVAPQNPCLINLLLQFTEPVQVMAVHADPHPLQPWLL